jgi:hypothetical protein
MLRSAVVVKPSTLLNLHAVLTKRKYQQLFSPRSGHRPGPKGPTQELIDAVVAMKRRNPTWGCPRIAQQIALAFAVEVDKDVVRRILSTHYRPDSDAQVPSDSLQQSQRTVWRKAKAVDVGARRIALFNIDGIYHAIDDLLATLVAPNSVSYRSWQVSRRTLSRGAGSGAVAGARRYSSGEKARRTLPARPPARA